MSAYWLESPWTGQLIRGGKEGIQERRRPLRTGRKEHGHLALASKRGGEGCRCRARRLNRDLHRTGLQRHPVCMESPRTMPCTQKGDLLVFRAFPDTGNPSHTLPAQLPSTLRSSSWSWELASSRNNWEGYGLPTKLGQLRGTSPPHARSRESLSTVTHSLSRKDVWHLNSLVLQRPWKVK